MSFGLYAAQSYVDRRLPSTRLDAADVARHDFVGYDGPLQQSAPAQWLLAEGVKRFSFRSNSDYAIEEAALSGQGICLLAKAQGRALSGLVELGYSAALPTLPIYLVFHKELRNVPRYRLVVNTLHTSLRQALA